MEKWQAEKIRNLQDRIDELEYESDCINNLEPHEFVLRDIDSLGCDYFLNDDEMDIIRNVLLKANNREISALEGELSEI